MKTTQSINSFLRKTLTKKNRDLDTEATKISEKIAELQMRLHAIPLETLTNTTILEKVNNDLDSGNVIVTDDSYFRRNAEQGYGWPDRGFACTWSFHLPCRDFQYRTWVGVLPDGRKAWVMRYLQSWDLNIFNTSGEVIFRAYSKTAASAIEVAEMWLRVPLHIEYYSDLLLS